MSFLLGFQQALDSAKLSCGSSLDTSSQLFNFPCNAIKHSVIV